MPQPLRHFHSPARSLVGLTLFLTLLFFSAPLFAQLGSGQIEGTVADAMGAVVAKAKVTVTNTGTGVSRELTTSDSGLYRATNLQPGTYTVKAEASGFAGVERKAEVIVGTTTTADLTLGVQGAKESMTVSEAAPLIETESSDVGTNISKEVIENVPVTGRRWENFVLLSPGVTNDGTFGLISYRGISGLYNNNQLDGADNNQAFFSEARGRDRVAYTYSQAAIKEFKVGLSSETAEFGRAAGGSVNAVTKSGTNDFHGQAFYFIRDSFTTAKDPFIDQDTVFGAIGDTKLPERRQQFGVAMGGPFIKEKLFWFASYDQQLRNFPYVVDSSSDFFATFIGPDTRTDCTGLVGNQLATCEWMDDQRTVVPRKGLQEIGLFKLDWVLNDRHNLTLYANVHRWRGQTRSPYINTNAASDNAYNLVRTTTLHAKWNWVISPTTVNEFRFSHAYDRDSHNPFAPGPGTSVTGGFTFGQPDFLPRPKYPYEKRFQFADSISLTRGAHTVKFGADINYVKETLINLFQGGGVYSYSNFSSLAGDCPIGSTVAPYNCVPDGTPSYNTYTQAFDTRVLAGDLPVELSGSNNFNTTDWNFFVQDTWKVRSNLTLNLGLRYEYQALPQPTTPNPDFPLTQSINKDKNNFAPRLGVAWDLFGNHRTVLNGSYGLYYGRTSNSTIFSALTDNGALVKTITWRTSTADRPVYPDCFFPAVNSTCTLDPTASLGIASTPDIFQLSEDFGRPFVHQAQFSLEHELFENTMVSATYAYAGGRGLPVYTDRNLPAAGAEFFVNVTTPLLDQGGTELVPVGTYGPLPFYCTLNGDAPAGNCPVGSRPLTNVRRLMTGENVARSSYNALILRLSRRMRRGIQFDSHFTWAKALDNGQNSTTFFGRSTTNFDPLNRDLDRSRGDFDVRTRFVTSFVWEPVQTFNLEGGARTALDWKISGTVSANSGKPISPNVSGFLSTSDPDRTRAIDGGSLNGTGGTFRFPFVSRNAFDQPGFANLDLRITRNVQITEGKRLEFLVEAFNLFNRVNITRVDNTGFRLLTGDLFELKNTTTCGSVTIDLGDRCMAIEGSSGFLSGRQASSTLTNMREFQFAARFHW